jgi:hypothetical protein
MEVKHDVVECTSLRTQIILIQLGWNKQWPILFQMANTIPKARETLQRRLVKLVCIVDPKLGLEFLQHPKFTIQKKLIQK